MRRGARGRGRAPNAGSLGVDFHGRAFYKWNLMNMDAAAKVDAVTRRVETIEKDGRQAKVVVVRRTYPTGIEDLWDAVTSIARIPRWFAPVTGELEVGGRYQIEGNAGGEVLSCDPPQRFEITWVYDSEVSWVVVELTTGPGRDEATLELRHTAHPPEEFWDQFGPGAVGVGWDLSVLGLALHVDSGEAVDPATVETWSVSPEGRAFIVAASTAWGDAAVADGEVDSTAQRRAAAAAAFYTGELAGAPLLGVNAFDVLGDPVRRSILELLASGDRSSGEVVDAIATRFGISQPAVSQHLRVLRESGFATVRPEGTRRWYSIDLSGIEEVDVWLSNLRRFWDQRLDALGTEISRGKRQREQRQVDAGPPAPPVDRAG